MIPIFLIVIITLFVTWLIFELVTFFSQKMYSSINYRNRHHLIEELKHSTLNSYNNDIITLYNKTPLRGSFIAKTKTSLLFPYYLSDYKKDYYITLFSIEYFLVKENFKKLNPNKINMKFILFITLITLISCNFPNKYRCCGNIKRMYETQAGYKVSGQKHIVFFCDSTQRYIDVEVTNNTYANTEVGKEICFDLLEYQIR